MILSVSDLGMASLHCAAFVGLVLALTLVADLVRGRHDGVPTAEGRARLARMYILMGAVGAALCLIGWLTA